MEKLQSAIIGMGEEKPDASEQKTDTEVSKSGSMEDGKMKQLLSQCGSCNFFAPKISVTKNPILHFSSLSKHILSPYEQNKIQVFSNKEISSEDEDVRFPSGDLYAHSSLLVKFPGCATSARPYAVWLSWHNASRDVLRSRTALGDDASTPEKHF